MSRGQVEKRGAKPRRVKPIILIVTEGAKSEPQYFEKFHTRENNIEIRVVSNSKEGSKTDYVNLIRRTVSYRKQYSLSVKQGDSFWVIADGDVNYQMFDAIAQKNRSLQEARRLGEKEQICLLISNPCFELWYLLHYIYTTRSFQNYNEVKNALQKAGMSGYEKRQDVYVELRDRIRTAVLNAKKLEEYHRSNGAQEPFDVSVNPYTEVYKLVEKL